MDPAARRSALERARLYLICDARPAGRDPARFLDAALNGGVDVVQLRDKRLDDDALLRAADVFSRCCEDHGALFVLNDRPDLAVRAGADGVHVGQEDMAVGEARLLAGEGVLVGRSTHSVQQADAGAAADYIGVGPVHATPTKPGRAAVGLELVRYAAAAARVPFFAIGGIDPSNVDRVVAAGAQRVAVVRAIVDAPDPEAAARELRAAVEAQVAVGPT
jgi:thiamine-phosphate pyrophosphorylase